VGVRYSLPVLAVTIMSLMPMFFHL